MTVPAEVAEDLDRQPDRDGLDGDTARLYRQIVASDRCCRLAADDAPLADLSDVLVLVMPGAFHGEHAHTGADGRRVRQLASDMGCASACVEVGSFDSMHANAERLIACLRENAHRRIVLVSLSKGGADVKTAMRQSPSDFAAVRCWVSFSGLLNGTHLVNWLRRRPWRWAGVRALLWWRGHSIETLRELRTGDGSPLDGWPALPPHLRLIQVLGFPARRHLQHRWATRGYDRLAPLGPNDGGGILLADVLKSPGEICPVWAADHYLQPAWDIAPLLRSLMRTALLHASQSAPTASAAPAIRSTT